MKYDRAFYFPSFMGLVTVLYIVNACASSSSSSDPSETHGDSSNGSTHVGHVSTAGENTSLTSFVTKPAFGELDPSQDYFSYEEEYIDEAVGTESQIPALTQPPVTEPSTVMGYNDVANVTGTVSNITAEFTVNNTSLSTIATQASIAAAKLKTAVENMCSIFKSYVELKAMQKNWSLALGNRKQDCEFRLDYRPQKSSNGFNDDLHYDEITRFFSFYNINNPWQVTYKWNSVQNKKAKINEAVNWNDFTRHVDNKLKNWIGIAKYGGK